MLGQLQFLAAESRVSAPFLMISENFQHQKDASAAGISRLQPSTPMLTLHRALMTPDLAWNLMCEIPVKPAGALETCLKFDAQFSGAENQFQQHWFMPRAPATSDCLRSGRQGVILPPTWRCDLAPNVDLASNSSSYSVTVSLQEARRDLAPNLEV